MSGRKELMIFELAYGGHYAFYIKHLLAQAKNQDKFHHIHVVVSSRFLESHAEVVEWAALNCKMATFYSAAGSDEVFSRDKSYTNSHIVKRNHELLELWVSKIAPDSCFLSNIGTFQVAFALGKRIGTKTQFSGLHFSPMFHYKSTLGQKLDVSEMIRALRQRFLMRLALRSPQLKTIFFLDPYAADFLNRYRQGQKKAKFLPDPVEVLPENRGLVQKLKQELQLESDRVGFLLFGALTERKGIFAVLEAISLLNPIVASKTTVIFAGVVRGAEEVIFRDKLTKIQKESSCQIIFIDRFVTDEEAIQLFHLSDVILAPYIKHVGMSGIVLRAAAAHKPIICSDYGLIGKITKDYELGLVVDTQIPQTISDAIGSLSGEANRPCLSDGMKAEKLVSRHSIEKFAETLYQNV